MLWVIDVESSEYDIDKLPLSLFPAFVVEHFIRLFLNPNLFQDFCEVEISTFEEQFQSSKKLNFYMALDFPFYLLLRESWRVRNSHFFIQRIKFTRYACCKNLEQVIVSEKDVRIIIKLWPAIAKVISFEPLK